MKPYCELTKQQIEAALNFIRYINEERARGRAVDIKRLRSVVVHRDPQAPNKASFQMDFEEGQED